jgi:hypothetical protein
VHIWDMKVKVLKNKVVILVNVKKTCYFLEDSTRELKETMWEESLQVFTAFNEF